MPKRQRERKLSNWKQNLNKTKKRKNTRVPFRISKLVTRLSASRGDLLKNFGVRFGGRVSGLRFPPVPVIPLASQARIEPCDRCNRSRCSVETGRCWFLCFGYQPRAGPPAKRSISPLANAWLMVCCRPPPPPPNVFPVENGDSMYQRERYTMFMDRMDGNEDGLWYHVKVFACFTYFICCRLIYLVNIQFYCPREAVEII